MLLLESIILIAVSLAVGYRVQHPPSSLHVVTNASVDGLLAMSRPEVRGVQFGGRFVLQGLVATRSEEELILELVWESRVAQPLVFTNAIHLVDEQGTILAQTDYPQDYAKSRVRPGTVWKDVVRIPRHKLKGVNSVAVAVYEPRSGTLAVDRGPRDWDNHRLLLRLE